MDNTQPTQPEQPRQSEQPNQPKQLSEFKLPTKEEQLGINLINAIKLANTNWMVKIELFSFQAKTMKAKYDSLLEEGFTERQALALCNINWNN